MGGVRILEWLAPAVPVEGVDWEAVYREEMPRVFNYFRYRGLERALAEDLTSATFEKAWRARDRYRRERAAVSTWLLAIARNVAIDHFRRSRPEVAARGRRGQGRRDAGDGGPARRAVPSARRAAARRCPSASGSCWRSSTGRTPPTVPLRRSPGSASRTWGRSCTARSSRCAPGGTKEDHSERRFPVPAPRGTPARVQGPPGRPTARDRRARARATAGAEPATGASCPPWRAPPSWPRSLSPSPSSPCGPRRASSSTSSG